MKTFFPFLIAGIIIVFSSSCKRSNPKTDFSADSTRITDSLFHTEKPVNINYTFSDPSIISASLQDRKGIDTLPAGYMVFIDSLNFGNEANNYASNYYIKYIKQGKVKQGVVHFDDLAQAFTKSKKDSSMVFMAGYAANADKESATAILKVCKGGRIVSNYKIDENTQLGYEISVAVMDSVSLAGIDELVFVDVYFPACGYTNTQYYFNYTGGKFQEVITTNGFADAPYFAYEDIYMPMQVNNQLTLVNFYSNYPLRDTLGKYTEYKLPEHLLADASKIFVVHFQQNGDSVDVNQQPVKDPEYDEPFMVITESTYTLYKWENGKATELKP